MDGSITHKATSIVLRVSSDIPPVWSVSHKLFAMPAGRPKKEVVVRDNVIGLLYGENFSPESNFYIKEVVNFVNMQNGSGYLVKIKSTVDPTER